MARLGARPLDAVVCRDLQWLVDTHVRCAHDQAPRLLLVAVSVLTVVSIAIAWINAQYFAERLARLAQSTSSVAGGTEHTDEFDRIERAVGKLGSALSAAEAERERTNEMAAARLREQGTMLAGVVSDSIGQLDQVRLPLQILLNSPFGELNENQEELLRDARAAADSIDVALRRLGQVADIDRDAMPVSASSFRSMMSFVR